MFGKRVQRNIEHVIAVQILRHGYRQLHAFAVLNGLRHLCERGFSENHYQQIVEKVVQVGLETGRTLGKFAFESANGIGKELHAIGKIVQQNFFGLGGQFIVAFHVVQLRSVGCGRAKHEIFQREKNAVQRHAFRRRTFDMLSIRIDDD